MSPTKVVDVLTRLIDLPARTAHPVTTPAPPVPTASKVGAYNLNSEDQTIRYSPAILKSLRPPQVSCSNLGLQPPPTPQKQHRKRGRKGGIREKNKRRKSRLYVPSVVFGNTRSLNNKIEELQASCRHLYEYRDTSVLGFTETWFEPCTPDQSVKIDGFTLLRGDRTSQSGKVRGGGVCLYINERWAHPNNITIKNKQCTPDLELLTAHIRPFFLPREFTSVIINIVYIPPTADSKEAMSELHQQYKTKKDNEQKQ
ncbi:hypothetical protein EGW08_006643 [Elysia chlorotica]|uniref:Uncharacterized protein n=1 Tax=Elysia chlorotica TaxID=188477 RepID=A0A433TVL8_ELYCH|nr:hypothetical protein EGW08_006643 [Elysia chlorotica]